MLLQIHILHKFEASSVSPDIFFQVFEFLSDSKFFFVSFSGFFVRRRDAKLPYTFDQVP